MEVEERSHHDVTTAEKKELLLLYSLNDVMTPEKKEEQISSPMIKPLRHYRPGCHLYHQARYGGVTNYRQIIAKFGSMSYSKR